MQSRSRQAGIQDGAHAAQVIANALASRERQSGIEQLAAVRAELADVYRELYEAAQLQRKVCGPRGLRRGGFDLAAEIFPVRYLSGDFFSICECGDEILLAIGDISGKGLTAGIWFTRLMGLIENCAQAQRAPGEVLAAVNRQMRTAAATPLTSLFLARLNVASGEVVYSNAGHPPPVVLRTEGEVESLSRGGTVLGALAEGGFETGTVWLRGGDTLIGCSDGLLEATNDAMEEFGVQRIIEEARRTEPAASASEMLFSIIGAARVFSGAQERNDDCAMIVVRAGEGARAQAA